MKKMKEITQIINAGLPKVNGEAMYKITYKDNVRGFKDAVIYFSIPENSDFEFNARYLRPGMQFKNLDALYAFVYGYYKSKALHILNFCRLFNDELSTNLSKFFEENSSKYSIFKFYFYEEYEELYMEAILPLLKLPKDAYFSASQDEDNSYPFYSCIQSRYEDAKKIEIPLAWEMFEEVMDYYNFVID